MKMRWYHWSLFLLYFFYLAACVWYSSFLTFDDQRYFWMVDDAMISMRYAWHLAHGHGLIWNIGEYVEGYTNFLMVLLMTPPNYFFSKQYAVLVAQILSCATNFGTGFMLVRLLKSMPQIPKNESSDLPLVTFLVLLLTFLYQPFTMWSVGGMETGLLTFLVVWSLCLTFESIHKSSGRAWLGFLYFLMVMTRPDSMIFVVLCLFYICLKKKREEWRSYSPTLLVCFGGIALHTAWRSYYYGSFIPNTALLKLTGAPLSFRMVDGWNYLYPFLWDNLWFLCFLLVVLMFFWM